MKKIVERCAVENDPSEQLPETMTVRIRRQENGLFVAAIVGVPVIVSSPTFEELEAKIAEAFGKALRAGLIVNYGPGVER